MRLAALYIKALFPRLTGMVVVAVFCLIYAPTSVRAAIVSPSPQASGAAAAIEAETEGPPFISQILRTSLPRFCLGLVLSGAALENSSPRKKKKKISTDPKHSVCLSWLSIFTLPHRMVVQNFAPSIVREDIPCLPSWRGFVFFSLPPPDLA